MSRRRAIVAGCIGAAALVGLLACRQAYGDFLPLRGYSPIHAHVMAPQEGLFLALFTVLGTLAAAGLGFCLFGLVRVGVAERLEDLGERLSTRASVALLAVAAVLGAVVVWRLVLGGAFLTDDEMAMLFQARLLSEGRLYADPTPYPGVFAYAMMVEEPRWYGIYPIGHPAMMALSLLLTGSAHTIVAFVAAGWALLTYTLARRLHGRGGGLLSGALLLISPFFVLSSGSLASEMTSGLFLLGAANCAVRLDGSRKLLAAAGLGLCLGAAYLARPYTALAVGLPLGYLLLRLWVKGKAPAWSPLVVALAGAPFAGIYLWVNAELTGSPWLTPYEVNFPGLFRLGFGQDAFGVVHTPGLALAVAALAVLSLNAWALGWPLSLLPVGLALGIRRPRGRALVIATIPAVVLLAHLPVPMAGVHDTGPLYYLEVLPFIVILAARGLQLTARRLEEAFERRGRDLVVWMAVSATAVGLLFFDRQQVEVLRSLSEFDRAPYELAERVIDGRAVVFVDDIQTSPPSTWVLGNRPPEPDMSDRVVYANVPSQEVGAAVVRWSGRRPYYMSRDGRSGDVTLLPLPLPAGASLR